MILSICCWICVFTLCQGKYVEVNNEGNDCNDCYTAETCLCRSLFKALSCVEDDTVINITSSLVTLHNATHMGSRNNIMIVGNEVTVACNDSGSLDCFYCSNIVIKGIIWDQCGNPNDSSIVYAIGFGTAVNVTIMACTFRYSKVCTVVVVYLLSSGFIKVHDSRFLFNHVTKSSQCAAKELYGSLIITDSGDKVTQNAYVSIRRTLFYHNGPYLNVRQPNGYVLSSASLFCGFLSPRAVKLDIENVTISTTFGLGGNFYFYYTSDVTVQFTNVNFLNNSNGGSVIRILSSTSKADVLRILSCNYTNNVNGALKVLISNLGSSEVTFHKLTIMGNKGTFREDRAIGSDAIDQGVGILTVIRNAVSKVDVSYCNIYDNIGSKNSSVVYIMVIAYTTRVASITSSNFSNNVGSALYLSSCTVEFGGHVLFMNNSAVRGGAIHLDQGSQIAIKEISSIRFIGNNAVQQGGAIFIELSSVLDVVSVISCPYNGIVITNLSNTSNVSFTDNSAGIIGNSVYFNIPESCSIIREALIYKFNYSQSAEIIGPFIASSPHKISVCSTTSNDTDSSICHISNGNMLGHPVGINATVYDYFDHISETVQFYVECTNCNSTYRLSNNKILVHNGLFDIIFLSVDADNDIIDDVNVTLQLSSVLPNEYRQLTATISLKLSSCKSGYVFDINIQQCECYEQSEDIIQCQQDYAEIKYGYWFGVRSQKRTVSLCPVHYCGFNTETGSGYYILPERLSDQCSSHRTGVACGECSEGYTLAFDSPECINIDRCSAGITFLVLVLTILYWIIVVALVFGLMQRKVSLGYVYGLIYYYSIIDILLGSNLFISNGVFQLVTILSSFAKLTPQFLGRLCFVQRLSGIDQQFIHYFHAISIFLLIVITIIVARYSRKIASIVGHCIIRVICLLILLSYTSLASTSLQLLRPLYFDDVNDVYVYSSPSIKYFTGRHIAYGIIALLCGLFIVIGLPLLLLLEPFLKRKVNFIKIKPLLDQFQECYKDQYHWFSAYYLVCRQVIIAIVYVSKSLYYLQTACVIIVMIHVWIKPYKSKTLNVLDGIILLTMILVVNLNSFVFSRPSITTIVVIIVIFPLILSSLICIRNFVSSMKYTWNHKKLDNSQEVLPKSVKYVYAIN